MTNYAIAIHGGAGTILKSTMTPEKETLYKTGLQQAIEAGEAVLKKGGSSCDAVEKSLVCQANQLKRSSHLLSTTPSRKPHKPI